MMLNFRKSTVKNILVANKNKTAVQGEGEVLLEIIISDTPEAINKKILLKNVLFVPSVATHRVHHKSRLPCILREQSLQG